MNIKNTIILVEFHRQKKNEDEARTLHRQALTLHRQALTLHRKTKSFKIEVVEHKLNITLKTIF